ncbi:AAA family ATPase [Janthinobacterium lividum]|uniref:AAA family ATPase n=1 Tax=Janthinobacterium lividum TaxID=29581 RepID=UPI0014093E75|nr:AAA family ATPase [Janthinobacterium lividum]NHQ94290.1 AAA family ATPase [Janthinobacterium lividum]
MIRISRSLVSTPLSDGQRSSLRRKAHNFFESATETRRQDRYDFDTFDPDWDLQSVRAALTKLFHGKCAYCESSLFTESGYVHRHRPAKDTISETGEYLPDHYWWMAYRWSNLFLACAVCARAKGSKFPIEGTRSPIDGKAVSLRAERPLLINPCEDDPSKHLISAGNGKLLPRTKIGFVTIETLDLNRSDLVNERQRLAQIASLASKEELNDMMSDRAPFSGFVRSLAFIRTDEGKVALAIARLNAQHLSERAVNEDGVSADGVVETDSSNYIAGVSLSNVGPFDDITIDLNRSTDERAPWLAIIGENNIGKTSILKGIAVALAGGRAIKDCKPSMFSGSDQGGVTVELSKSGRSSVRWNTRNRLEASQSTGKVLIFAYGATRLLARDDDIEDRSRITNLFDPYRGLTDPVSWLLSLSNEQFDYAARALKSISHLQKDARLERNQNTNEVFLRSHDVLTPFNRLSDGLQSMHALACDIMSGLLEHYVAAEIAEGIILIDEIENHLHPKWKMRLIPMLRKAFPRMQFIVTTHDPLCLKGLSHGEVLVLRRDQHGVVRAIENLPDIGSMRVDQILTSEHFGLSSAVDPDLERLFEEYYTLLRRDEFAPADRSRLDAITLELQSQHQFGFTRRERLMLGAIDRYLSGIPEAELDSKRLLSDLNRKLAQLSSPNDDTR